MISGYKTKEEKPKEFDITMESQLKPVFSRYGRNRPALLPCLENMQETAGYISPDSVEYLSTTLGIHAADIYGVISFYGMLTTAKQGKYIVRLCNSVSCNINGSQTILELVENELGIKDGETTSDNLFTLEVVACLGLCDRAPAMMINDQVFGHLNAAGVKKILNGIKEKEL